MTYDLPLKTSGTLFILAFSSYMYVIWETIPSLIFLGFSPVFKKLRYSLVTIMWIICIVPCVVKLHPLCRTEWKRGHRVFHNISTESLLCTIIMCCYLVCILKWHIENEIWSFLNLTKYSETHYTIKKNTHFDTLPRKMNSEQCLNLVYVGFGFFCRQHVTSKVPLFGIIFHHEISKTSYSFMNMQPFLLTL